MSVECPISGGDCIHGCRDTSLCESEAERLAQLFFKQIIANAISSLRNDSSQDPTDMCIDELHRSSTLLGFSLEEERRLEIMAIQKIPDLIAQKASVLASRINLNIPPDDHIKPDEISGIVQLDFEEFDDL